MGSGLDRFDWFVTRVVAGTLDADAVREGFAPSFLEAISPDQILQFAASLKDLLSPEADARTDMGTEFLVSYGQYVATGAVEHDAPHRFVGLRVAPAAPPLDDERLVDPPISGEGAAPLGKLGDVFAQNGLVGVVAAAYADDGADEVWRAAAGYTDLDTRIACTPTTRMFAGSICKLVTATAALQLVAQGRVALDDSANDHLRSLRVASDAVTIRHLLTHTSGVSSAFNHFVEQVGPPESVLGDVVAIDFEPGSQRVYSNGGYTVLGEVIAAALGAPVVEVLTSRVLEPLGMRDSSYPSRWPDDVGPGYEVENGKATPVARLVPSVAAAGGLVTTTADLARFVVGWSGLLPADLAAEATSPLVPIPEGGAQGYGWIVGQGVRGHAGGTYGHTSSLLWWDDGEVRVLMTNRNAAAQDLNLALRA